MCTFGTKHEIFYNSVAKKGKQFIRCMQLDQRILVDNLVGMHDKIYIFFHFL